MVFGRPCSDPCSKRRTTDHRGRSGAGLYGFSAARHTACPILAQVRSEEAGAKAKKPAGAPRAGGLAAAELHRHGEEDARVLALHPGAWPTLAPSSRALEPYLNAFCLSQAHSSPDTGYPAGAPRRHHHPVRGRHRQRRELIPARRRRRRRSHPPCGGDGAPARMPPARRLSTRCGKAQQGARHAGRPDGQAVSGECQAAAQRR